MPGWAEVDDLYYVLGEIRVVADRLPQVLNQLARHLERPAGVRSYKTDAGTSESPESLVAEAVLTLEGAQHHVAEVGIHLNAAHSAVAHLYTSLWRCPGLPYQPGYPIERGSGQQMER